jgi:hypothetical protein
MRRLAAAVLCLAALAGCTSTSSGDQPIPGVETFKDLAHTHVTTPVTYPQVPPVGGPHAPAWLKCDVYTEPVPNENAVHAMEHGAVWITYRPGLAQGDLDTLHRLQGLKPGWVLMSPYAGLPTAVVASAWGLQLTVDKVDDARLGDFVKRYAGGDQGGEKGTRCDNGLTPAQIAQLNAAAAASASANPTPSG